MRQHCKRLAAINSEQVRRKQRQIKIARAESQGTKLKTHDHSLNRDFAQEWSVVFGVKTKGKKMDIYPMVLIALIAAILLTILAWAIYAIVTHKDAFNDAVAKNVVVAPLNYEEWAAKRSAANQRKAKAIAEFQELKELNADFSAIISGE